MSENKQETKLLFDKEWYLENNPDIAKVAIDPLSHFRMYGWKEGRDPSKYFKVEEYIEKNPEILPINMDPFTHIAFTYSNSSYSSLEFAPGLKNVEKEFKPLDNSLKYKRVIILASFISNGVIPKYLLLLLGKLKKISDAIIFIGDNPILPDEVKKLSNLVHYVSFNRHEEYDFGSYKRGYEYLENTISLENIEEIIFCNDSCIGPVVPFEEMFTQMAEKKLDFWGITSNEEVLYHLQSYFLVFSQKVFLSEVFKRYCKNVKKEESRADVITKYELPFTKALVEAGFTCDSYITYPDYENFISAQLKHQNLTLSPAYLIKKACPLIKIKSFNDGKLNFTGIDYTFELLLKINPALESLVREYFSDAKNNKKFKPVSKGNNVNIFEKTLLFLKLTQELKEYRQSIVNSKKFRESATVHKYLNGLNGIEIGAASHNPFGLDKTGGYANVDYKANHGDLWQPGSNLEPAKVNIVSSGDDLPFKDESLDYVISSHAIEHFFDPIKTIKEWFRVVKKNGYVIMIVPHKNRTFDRLRPVTQVEELVFRHKNILLPEHYLYKTDVEPTDKTALPEDYLKIVKNSEIPIGYSYITQDVDVAHLHLSVWDTESFVELCRVMKWNLVEVLDYDDKVGNGFLIVLKKT